MLYEYLFLFVGMTLLDLVGVCDDLVGVGYRYKFAVQIVSALLLVLSGNWFGSLGGLFGVQLGSRSGGDPRHGLYLWCISRTPVNLIDGKIRRARPPGFAQHRPVGLERDLLYPHAICLRLVGHLYAGSPHAFLVLQRLWQRKPWP